MDRNEQRRIVEALVMASPEPLSAARIAELIPYVKPGKAKDLVNELNTEYQERDRAFEIWEVAGGYQMRTRAEFSGYLQKLQRLRPLRLSRAALETLSIVAYKQPATRAEIEQVRGVECGPVLRSLLDRHLVRISGHREVPGRPIEYGTTRRFLEVFGLQALKDLPALRELDEIARDQGLDGGEEEELDGEQAEGAELAEGEPEASTAGEAAGPGDDLDDSDAAGDGDDFSSPEALAAGSDPALASVESADADLDSDPGPVLDSDRDSEPDSDLDDGDDDALPG